MLHVVASSPYTHTTLMRCLNFMQPEDQLLLVQDAVIASATDKWCSLLQDKTVYVLQPDLIARGLVAKTGKEIDMAGYVELVINYGSPLSW